MLLNSYEYERYLKVAADRANMRIVWEDKTLPRTDGKTVFLPRITSRTTEDDAKRLMWYVTHEASHAKHTNFQIMKDKYLDPTKSQLAALFNQLEDDNIDFINGNNFKGDRELCADQVAKFLPELLEQAKQKKAEGKDKEMGKAWDNTMAQLAFEADFRSDYCYGTSHLTEEFKKLTNNLAESKWDKLLSGSYKEQLRKLREDQTDARTAGVYELAKQIYEEVMDGDAAKEEERLKQMAGGGDGEQEEEGEEQEGKGKAKKAKRGKGGGEREYSDQRVDVEYDKWSTDADDFVRHQEVSGGQNVHYREADMGRDGSYLPCASHEFKVVDYVKGTSNHRDIQPMDEQGGKVREYYEHEYYDLAKTSSDGFANRVRMLLQIRSKGKTMYGTKRGALHAGNLYRTTIKDAPGYNERVFKKRITSDVLDTCVQIIVDDSGSMMGAKLAHAMVAAIHLSDTLGNTLHIPVEILGFTEHGSVSTMFVFRSFDNKLLSKEKLLDRMIHAGRFSANNADGDAVLFGYNRIVPRREKRKVMIVLSDGSPAGTRAGDLPAFTKEVISSIEKGKKVEIVGVGIQDRNVARFYSEHYTIRQPQEIEPALLKLIKRKML